VPSFTHLPPFTPINSPAGYIINRSTDTYLLHELLHFAQNTKYFSLDTESDFLTMNPSLIQIEMIGQRESVVILVEVCHLPFHRDSLSFSLIRSLLKFILKPTNIIYVWGNGEEELSRFVRYRLFTSDALEGLKMVNLQSKFKDWHQESYGFSLVGKNKWGLQAAIADQCGEFLNKSERLNTWSRGLHRRRTDPYWRKIQSMIFYAVNDCLAVTKLAQIMNKDIVSGSLN
jgi:3'-5' exonuclease